MRVPSQTRKVRYRRTYILYAVLTTCVDVLNTCTDSPTPRVRLVWVVSESRYVPRSLEACSSRSVWKIDGFDLQLLSRHDRATVASIGGGRRAGGGGRGRCASSIRGSRACVQCGGDQCRYTDLLHIKGNRAYYSSCTLERKSCLEMKLAVWSHWKKREREREKGVGGKGGREKERGMKENLT